ncbi:hypothetical protein [Kushneria phosphatilytica]|uniref:hypothetical protein n=1 Tax=Kushneria phosphatilytica TaxID=657387 RepID=UPI0026A3C160
MNPLALFAETFNVTAPVFAMVLLGIALKQLKWIDHAFIDTASRLVFRGAMPTLIFLSLIDADMSQAVMPKLLLYMAVMTVISFVVIWSWARQRIPVGDRGAYVQRPLFEVMAALWVWHWQPVSTGISDFRRAA